MTRLVGFYPGSFDPLTNGHLDVIERACKLVDELIVGVGVNLSKKPLFSHADRMTLLKQTLEPIGKQLWYRHVMRDDNYIEEMEQDLVKFERLVSECEAKLRFKEAA